MTWAAVLLGAGLLVLLLAVAGAIMARRRWWSPRVPVLSGPERPRGTVAVAALRSGDADRAIPAQLADWQTRGVIEVAPIAPYLAADAAAGVSPGPRWRFVLGDTTGLGDEERVLVEAFFGDGDAMGTVFVLDQRDQQARDVMRSAVRAADALRLEASGGKRRVAVGVSRALIGVAASATLVAGSAAVVALDAGSAAAVWIGASLALGVVVVVCARPTRLPDEELEFRARVRAVRHYVRTATAEEVRDELWGWALLEGLPGPWSDRAPAAVGDLHHREDAFRRVNEPDLTDYVPS